MALQGTIETFALPDVLRLLAATRKTGRLHVRGEADAGDLWLDAGRVVAALLHGEPPSTEPTDVLVSLLRVERGSFFFEADAPAPDPQLPQEVEPLVARVEAMLDELRALSARVPSLDVAVRLVPELPHGDVVVDAARWRLLARIGRGSTLRQVGAGLSLSELALLRAVNDLLDLGLVELGPSEPGAGAAPPAPDAGAAGAFATATAEPAAPVVGHRAGVAEHVTDDPAPEAEAAMAEVARLDVAPAPPAASLHAPTHDPVPPSLAEFRSGLGQVGLASAAPEPLVPELVVPGTLGAYEGTHEVMHEGAYELEPLPGADDLVPVPAGGWAAEPDGDDDAGEIARQLANLSPRAAKAVAAAAKATTVEERDAALAVIEEEDGMNRGLLLKFLGAVDG